jgi:hypothetical protein
VQGHHVHVVGVDEGWSRELPGLIGPAEGGELDGAAKGKGSERMKIAWRYERLGEFRGVAGSRGGPPPCDTSVYRFNYRLRPNFWECWGIRFCPATRLVQVANLGSSPLHS